MKCNSLKRLGYQQVVAHPGPFFKTEIGKYFSAHVGDGGKWAEDNPGTIAHKILNEMQQHRLCVSHAGLRILMRVCHWATALLQYQLTQAKKCSFSFFVFFTKDNKGALSTLKKTFLFMLMTLFQDWIQTGLLHFFYSPVSMSNFYLLLVCICSVLWSVGGCSETVLQSNILLSNYCNQTTT